MRPLPGFFVGKIRYKKSPMEEIIHRAGVCGSFGGSFTLFRYFGGSFCVFGGSFDTFGGSLVGVFIRPILSPLNTPSYSLLYAGSPYIGNPILEHYSLSI